MPLNPKLFTIVSFPLRRDLHDKLKKMFPHYGDTSKVLRQLVEGVLSGRIKVKS